MCCMLNLEEYRLSFKPTWPTASPAFKYPCNFAGQLLITSNAKLVNIVDYSTQTSYLLPRGKGGLPYETDRDASQKF